MKKQQVMRTWQQQQIRYYEQRAAKRVLKQAIMFLVVYTILMTLAMAVSSMN